MEVRGARSQPPHADQGEPGGPVFGNTDGFSYLFSRSPASGPLPTPERPGGPHIPLSRCSKPSQFPTAYSETTTCLQGEAVQASLPLPPQMSCVVSAFTCGSLHRRAPMNLFGAGPWLRAGPWETRAGGGPASHPRACLAGAVASPEPGSKDVRHARHTSARPRPGLPSGHSLPPRQCGEALWL